MRIAIKWPRFTGVALCIWRCGTRKAERSGAPMMSVMCLTVTTDIKRKHAVRDSPTTGFSAERRKFAFLWRCDRVEDAMHP
jgi:hypothetical protein